MCWMKVLSTTMVLVDEEDERDKEQWCELQDQMRLHGIVGDTMGSGWIQ